MQRLEIVRIIQATASLVLILQLSLDIKDIRDDMEYQSRISEIRSKTFLVLRLPHIQIATIRLLLWQNACHNGIWSVAHITAPVNINYLIIPCEAQITIISRCCLQGTITIICLHCTSLLSHLAQLGLRRHLWIDRACKSNSKILNRISG